MASRRSHAAFYCRLSISAVSRGDTYLSETHCKLRRSAAVGRADSLSPSLGSAKRDRLFFSTSYGKRQSPFGELYGVEVSHVPTAALLRSLQWVSRYRSRSAEPQLILNLLVVRGCVATADAVRYRFCQSPASAYHQPKIKPKRC